MHLKRKKSKIQQKMGLSPGTLEYIGSRENHDISLELFDYETVKFRKFSPESIDAVVEDMNKGNKKWLNLNGLHDANLIRRIGNHLGLSNLQMEDLMNTEHPAKTEINSNNVVIILKSLVHREGKSEAEIEHFCMVLGDNYVVTFQQLREDPLDHLRKLLTSQKSKILGKGTDYLAYAVLDSLTDNLMLMVEQFREYIEDLESKMLSDNSDFIQPLTSLRETYIRLRRTVQKTADIVKILYSSELEFIEDNTLPYLKDVLEHLNHAGDKLEILRERISSLHDIQITNLSYRMNEVMKTLTIMATIFIPLTFLAGIYGMNFKYMPELDWPWAYPLLWFIMLVVGGLLILFFKRKKWF